MRPPARAVERAGNPKPVVVVPVCGGDPVAVGGAEVPRLVVPGTAAQHALAGGRSGPRDGPNHPPRKMARRRGRGRSRAMARRNSAHFPQRIGRQPVHRGQPGIAQERPVRLARARAPLAVGRPHRVAEGRKQSLGFANRMRRRWRCRRRRRGWRGGRGHWRGRRGSGCRRLRPLGISGIPGAGRRHRLRYVFCIRGADRCACVRAPRGGAFLSRRDLLRRHLRGQRIPLGQRRDLAPACSEIEPLVSLHIVLNHAETLNIQSPERQHRAPLACSRARPPLDQRLVRVSGVPRPLSRVEIRPGGQHRKKYRHQESRTNQQSNQLSFTPAVNWSGAIVARLRIIATAKKNEAIAREGWGTRVTDDRGGAFDWTGVVSKSPSGAMRVPGIAPGGHAPTRLVALRRRRSGRLSSKTNVPRFHEARRHAGSATRETPGWREWRGCLRRESRGRGRDRP